MTSNKIATIISKGEDDEYKKDTNVVTFWNLVRSYLLLHHPQGYALFSAEGMNDNNDFLNYSRCTSYKTKEELETAYNSIDQKDSYGNMAIRISEGIILD